jgi:N-acetylglucosamine-6-phosphate deacetylase
VTILIAGVVASGGETREGWISVEGERVAAAGYGAPPGTPDVVHDGAISRGLCDLQVNGAAGVEVTAGAATLDRIDAAMLAHGVTSYLPTVVSTDDETALRTVEDVAERARDPASQVEGAHMEGPFLSDAFRGRHRTEFLRLPDGPLPRYYKHPAIRLVTIAPELPGALELIESLVRRAVVVSMGHSGASYEEATRATEAGARLVTHLFNGMAPLHHREPGLVGHALSDPRLGLGVIADGFHVDAHVLRLIARLAADRVVLVSDASPAAGAPSGAYAQAGSVVERTPEGRAQTADGLLFGSALMLDEAVRNWRGYVDISLAAALEAAAARPARSIGLAGDLSTGTYADLVLMTEDGDVERVMRRGRWVA